MRIGKISWTSHQNLPILSVDAQPNGYRIVTGGTDHNVCIWNLLPIISEKYELINEEEKVDGENQANEDSNMQDGGQSQQSYNGKEGSQSQQSEDDELFEEDVKLMEGLFENKQMRGLKLLAVFDNHASPVNCVRWNNIGTLFASAADDGSIILWEYKGEKQMSVFEKSQFEGFGKENSNKLFNKKDEQAEAVENNSNPPKKPEMYEDWKAKKIWHGHKGGVSDLAWSPDSLHFASCGTDSIIQIWNINELVPITILECKANGLTFDPFGKFMASQSSEEKNLIIWRVQNFKNITKESVQNTLYKQSTGMSLFRRLSWSSDGTFISTTAGKIGTEYLAPLVNRSSWDQLATLSGHSKIINVTRINPKLFKSPGVSKVFDPSTGEYKDNLACYSIVALASIDSSISLWKPYMSKPFAVVLDLFKTGITDMTWAFNGNILLASSTDGVLMFVHFKPGMLGTPLTEFEKQIIIENKYGTTILNDYKKNTRILQNKTVFSQVPQNMSTKTQQHQENIVVGGKKKIVPVMDREYNDKDEIDPHRNPFQQLRESYATLFTQSQQIQKKPDQPINIQENQHQQHVQYKPPKEVQQVFAPKQAVETKLPPFSQAFGQPTQISQSESNKEEDKMQISKDIESDIDEKVKKFTSQQEDNKSIEMSGKKSKKTKRKKNDQVQPELLNTSMSMLSQNQASSQLNNPLGSKLVQVQNQAQNSQVLIQIERMLEQNKDVLAISLSDYQQIISIQGKEELSYTLPNKDIFNEEIRMFINNYDINLFNKRAELRILNSENAEVITQNIDREIVILVTINPVFFALCTNMGQLQIFSTRTSLMVKKGIYNEGIFMIDSDEQSGLLVVATLKGIVTTYQIKNPDFPNLDSCTVKWQQSITDILKRKSSSMQSPDLNSANQVYLKSLKVNKDGSVIIFLTDGSLFEYDTNIKQWREMSQLMYLPLLQNSDASKAKFSGQQVSKAQEQKPISQIIKLLEEQELDNNNETNDEDDQVKATNAQLAIINNLQEAVSLYERLELKNEFLHTLRTYIQVLIQNGDYLKLKDIMMDYKLFSNSEEDNVIDNKQISQLNPMSAIQNFISLLLQKNDDEEESSGQNTKTLQAKRFQYICGMDKREVCQEAIIPVLRTFAEINGVELQQIIQNIAFVIVNSQPIMIDQDLVQAQAAAIEMHQQLQIQGQEQMFQPPIQFTQEQQQLFQTIQYFQPLQNVMYSEVPFPVVAFQQPWTSIIEQQQLQDGRQQNQHRD